MFNFYLLLLFLLLLLPELLNSVQLLLHTSCLHCHHTANVLSLCWATLLDIKGYLKLDLGHAALLGLHLSHNTGLQLRQDLNLLLELRHCNNASGRLLKGQLRMSWELHRNLI